MKITPLEIRQKTFEKAFRGLDKEEVEAYLLSLSQEWERVLDENKEFKIKLEASQKEVEKLREVENSLFKTLKTAEDTGANMIDQAEKAAQLHLKESQIQSEAILNEAKTKARDMIEESEMRSRQTLEDMEEQLKALGQTYRMLEGYRDDLISNIRILANESMDKVERAAGQVKSFDLDEHIQGAKNITASFKVKDTPAQPEPSTALPDNTPKEEISIPEQDVVKNEVPEMTTESQEEELSIDFADEFPMEVEDTTKEKKGGSFFDDIE